MNLSFRNVDADPTDPVTSWPYEALVTAIDRGVVPDWQPIFDEIRRSPWGAVARRVERHLDARDHDGVSSLFDLAIQRARETVDRADRDEVAAQVRDAIERSCLTMAELASLVGTSASRLSTYASGKVTPSAALLLRIDRMATHQVREHESRNAAGPEAANR